MVFPGAVLHGLLRVGADGVLRLSARQLRAQGDAHGLRHRRVQSRVPPAPQRHLLQLRRHARGVRQKRVSE